MMKKCCRVSSENNGIELVMVKNSGSGFAIVKYFIIIRLDYVYQCGRRKTYLKICLRTSHVMALTTAPIMDASWKRGEISTVTSWLPSHTLAIFRYSYSKCYSYSYIRLIVVQYSGVIVNNVTMWQCVIVVVWYWKKHWIGNWASKIKIDCVSWHDFNFVNTL